MRSFAKIVTIFLVLMISKKTIGDTLSWEKNIKIKVGSNEYTIEQFKALSKETLQASSCLDVESAKIAIENIKTGDSATILKRYQLDLVKYRKLGLFGIQDMLRTLAYLQALPSFDETSAYKESVKAFQDTIGSNPTGELLGWEAEKLSEFSLPFMEINIDLSDSLKWFYISPFQDELLATGSWMKNGNDKKDENPNSVEIKCKKENKSCEELYTLISPSKSTLPNDYNIGASNNKYQIKKWNQDEILATDISKKCSIKTLIIDIPSEKVFLKSIPKMFDKDIPYACLPEGKQILTSIGRNLEPQSELMTLVDYSQAYHSMGMRTIEARREAMSPKYKELFKKFQILAK